MRIRWTRHFTEDFRRLSQDVRIHAEKTIRLLKENPRHPSLRAKKMEGTRGIFEARVSRSHRMTFHLEEDTIVLRRIGTHAILDKE